MPKEDVKEDGKPEAGAATEEATTITVASVQAECESFIQEKLNDTNVTPADLQRLIKLLHKLTKLIPAG